MIYLYIVNAETTKPLSTYNHSITIYAHTFTYRTHINNQHTYSDIVHKDWPGITEDSRLDYACLVRVNSVRPAQNSIGWLPARSLAQQEHAVCRVPAVG